MMMESRDKRNLVPPISGISFVALLGAVSLGRHAVSNGSNGLLEYLRGDADHRIQEAIKVAEQQVRPIAKPSDRAKESEFYRLREPEDILSDQWDLFCDRFGRSLQQRHGTRGFRDLIKAIMEIADNVFEHAGGCEGLAGFHFGDDHSIFSVADVGCGFLAALRPSQTWKDLGSEKAAISAVVRQGATSRDDQVTGGGFTDLFACLMEFNATVMIRSGGCVGKIFQDSGDRKLHCTIGGHLVGSQVTVVVKRTRDYVEKKM